MYKLSITIETNETEFNAHYYFHFPVFVMVCFWCAKYKSIIKLIVVELIEYLKISLFFKFHWFVAWQIFLVTPININFKWLT